MDTFIWKSPSAAWTFLKRNQRQSKKVSIRGHQNLNLLLRYGLPLFSRVVVTPNRLYLSLSLSVCGCLIIISKALMLICHHTNRRSPLCTQKRNIFLLLKVGSYQMLMEAWRGGYLEGCGMINFSFAWLFNDMTLTSILFSNLGCYAHTCNMAEGSVKTYSLSTKNL